jgi:hypothetical protein
VGALADLRRYSSLDLILTNAGAMRILVVEDEKKVASFLEKGLREEGYAVDVAHDGDDGLMRSDRVMGGLAVPSRRRRTSWCQHSADGLDLRANRADAGGYAFPPGTELEHSDISCEDRTQHQVRLRKPELPPGRPIPRWRARCDPGIAAVPLQAPLGTSHPASRR